jgi:XTP/dITP diphosphohydrolase
MMDKLRTAGPWESEQTHDSLRRFLLEETYEVFDAVRSGDADALREELGDVLLQVLFHARIAEDAPQHPFSIDDVADTLLRKLGNRVPEVLAGEEISLDDQLAQWEERKAQEKKAKKASPSVVDDVPTAQPALALAHKVVQRVTRAGLPAGLIPSEITSITVTTDVDAENALRTSVLEFMETVRSAEKAIAADRRGEDVPAELDVAPVAVITEEEWRAHWLPAVEALALAEEAEEPADDVDQAGGAADDVAEPGVEPKDDEPAAEEVVAEAVPRDGDAPDTDAPDTDELAADEQDDRASEPQ